MRFSSLQIITAVTFLLFLATLVWVLVILLKKQENTRERFAFAALTSYSTMVVTVLTALADNRSMAGELFQVVARLAGKEPKPDPPRIADHALMVLVLFLVAYFMMRMYEKWPGAVSVRQYEKQRYHEPAPFVLEGLHEAARVLRRDPPERLLIRSDKDKFNTALDPPQFSLAWHVQVRDLLTLRSQSYDIDQLEGWHDKERCWIGKDRKRNSVVAVKCVEHQPTVKELSDFVKYVRRLDKSERRGECEFILATREINFGDPLSISGAVISREDEDSLLSNLVDFSDYFSHIRTKVERSKLTDSSLTIADVYVPPKCTVEAEEAPLGFESYVQSWLNEPGQRQLALLGEYGQGKSTATLMLAYELLRRGESAARVPVLIELRGKSPRNMTPEEILAACAYPYNINPQAVMKLLIAGRLLLILEGFDEMALIGDSDARLAHFETLWKFCYPSAKVLITGRPNFFLDDREMRAALGIFRAAATGPYCEALRLHPFSIEQIEFALRKSPETTRSGIVRLARRDAKFREIVARGSLLYVVSQLWEREQMFRYDGPITSAIVMELFIEHSYRRQSEKTRGAPQFMVLSENERRYFMCGIAGYMGALDLPNQITREQFERAVKKLYEAAPDTVADASDGLPRRADRPLRQRLGESEDPVQDVANDVRATGILVQDESKSGALRFAHKSFMEYLLAKAYADYVLRRDREITGAIVTATGLLDRHLLRHEESVAFFSEIVIGSISGVAAQRAALSGEGARFLYDVIVVNSSGIRIFRSIRAWLAVRMLVDRASKELAPEDTGFTRPLMYLMNRVGSLEILMLSGATLLAQAIVFLVLHSAGRAGVRKD